MAVTWKAVSGATSYSVYRSTTAGSPGTLLGSTASLSLLDSSATAGVTYFYGVTASGGGSTSALSAQDSGFRAGALSSNLNVALAANGGVATASSTNGPGFPPGATIDNQRSGAGWGAGGGWNDASFGQFPDWLQVTFSSLRSIDRVVVYSVQDNYLSPVEPSDTMTFTKYGVTTFTVKGRSGSSWTVLGTITGNNRVKRTVTFPAFITDAIRIEVGNGLAGYSRLVEVEAWAVSAPSLPATLPATTSDISSTSNPALAGTQVTLTATVRGTRPTGSVKFSDGAVAIGGCTAVALTGGGNAPVAACNTSTLAIGTHAIVASYGGDAANAPSSAGLSQVIGGPGTSTNVALASVGAVATASSQFSAAYPVSAVNNGDRKGTGWGAGGGWNDASANVYPDTVQVVFNGLQDDQPGRRVHAAGQLHEPTGADRHDHVHALRRHGFHRRRPQRFHVEAARNGHGEQSGEAKRDVSGVRRGCGPHQRHQCARRLFTSGRSGGVGYGRTMMAIAR